MGASLHPLRTKSLLPFAQVANPRSYVRDDLSVPFSLAAGTALC